MRKTLTQKTLDYLPPCIGKRYEVRDTLLPGFMLRVSRNGGKVWYLVTRVHGRQRRIKIGTYPILSLVDAREKAIYRGGGLIDIVGVARSGLTIAVHPEDPKLRIMAHMKYSVSEQGASRVFELVMEEGKNRPILVWHGTTDITADELEASGNAAPKHAEPRGLGSGGMPMREDVGKE